MSIDLDQRLSADAVGAALASLKFRDEDARDALALRERVLTDAGVREVVQAAADAIAALEGNYLAGSVIPDADLAHQLGLGVPAVFALLATLPEALSWRPGQPRELALASLADFAQQVHIARLVHGRFGLGTYPWVQANWAGGLLWLGRLQFNVDPMWADLDGVPEGRPSWFIHIPQAGPLADEEAVASVERARVEMRRYYPDAGDRFYCGSWLLDPTVVRIAGEASNIARFAARFSEPLLLVENDRDPLFFGFCKEPPVDLATLPRDSRLRSGILDHYAADGHFHEAVCRWDG